MNSNRYLAQLEVESGIGCVSSDNLANHATAFDAYVVNHQRYADLTIALAADSKAIYIKAVRTFLQALAGLDKAEESWSLIKLYYSTFYFLRSALADDGCAILRCKNIYTLDIAVGNSPEKKNGAKYRGDHQATISIFDQRFSGRDILLSQSINQKSAYDWLKDRRDWINYKRREFFDITGEEGFTNREISFPKQVEMYCEDSLPIYCFDPDYASLALPVKRAQLSIKSRPDGVDLLNQCFEEYGYSKRNNPSCAAFLDSV